ncbi:hypothetical protein [Elizabethkingia anophelis]|uniref:hypothetical protein n=1 Tax=Elizabethkingia anophelis TaxID=1117645 RepID=UPI0003F96403|nr:hypothetical protein [Elizabethkingia anophelis]AQW95937.1 hypothetical protein BBD30_18035 [Elizabethkingia anophelis]KGT09982.1 hypothetical protein NV63_03270 [Elizabethkingia anophelis]MCT3697908.1 hypothetical protein [Elizabethkingia anophelis]MCT3758729.1 hypothetical protein [Elizabethkingia anophelis]MCT3897915.1 hypothetical protein [Elizabethkingia anophelis]
MKSFISIFIIFTIALRPVLPLLDYALNYDYIVSRLCENRNRPQLDCNGICYLSKELVKVSDSSPKQENSKINISGFIDAFIVNETFTFKSLLTGITHKVKPSVYYSDFYDFTSQTRIFRPPLVSIF